MLIKGYINHLCEETPIGLRMGVPAPTTKFVGLRVTLTETQRKAAINAPYQSRQDARKVEDWLEMQPQRFAMLGIKPDSYNAVVWVTSQFFGPLNSWWLNRKQRDSIPDMFDSLVTDIRKTSVLPNIRDDAINAMLGLAQGSLGYANYTQLFNDFLRRSRQPLTDDLQCICFISGLANFRLRTHAKSHRPQQKDYNMPMVEVQNLLNDLVTDLPHLGRARSAQTLPDNP
jgi:hypothetical protein